MELCNIKDVWPAVNHTPCSFCGQSCRCFSSVVCLQTSRAPAAPFVTGRAPWWSPVKNPPLSGVQCLNLSITQSQEELELLQNTSILSRALFAGPVMAGEQHFYIAKHHWNGGKKMYYRTSAYDGFLFSLFLKLDFKSEWKMLVIKNF